MWLLRLASSDVERLTRNIARLKALRDRVHELGYFAVASNRGGYRALLDLMDEQIVRGRPRIHNKLSEALIGENNQKVALDAPVRFQQIMFEAESVITHEINTDLRELRKLQTESKKLHPVSESL